MLEVCEMVVEVSYEPSRHEQGDHSRCDADCGRWRKQHGCDCEDGVDFPVRSCHMHGWRTGWIL